MVIVGSDRLAAKAWREFRIRRGRRAEVIGFVAQSAAGGLMPDIASRYLGNVAALPRIVLDREVDDVIVATPLGSDLEIVERAISSAGSLGARILCLKDICGIQPGDTRDILFELVPDPRLDGFRQAAKRLLDVIVSAVALLLGSLVFIGLVALGLVEGRPVLYQTEMRVGFRRRKFRSLHICSAPAGPRVKLFLEILPRMWNVLCGHMSLVGPRAMSEVEIARADIANLAGQFDVRPGIIDADSVELATAMPVLHEAPGWSMWAYLRILVRAFRSGTERTGPVETEAGAS
jgi:lipopolysaccharide/colanic/teichoic acid biosynthesis glycosyltransferase